MLKEVDSGEFRSMVDQGYVLAEFYSSTCGPCKMLSYILNDVEKICGDEITILKLDFDKNSDLVEQYHVSGYPTMILLRDGTELKRLSGLQQKPAIIRMIQEFR